MNPHNLQTNAVALLVTLASACGAATSDEAGRDESFLALMGSDGKADSAFVVEGSAEALAVLSAANNASFRDLHEVAGLDQRATANIIAHRNGNPNLESDNDPYDSLVELDGTPWVGVKAFNRLRTFAREAGYLDRVLKPISCDTSEQCGTGAVCHIDRCYDRIHLDVDVPMAAAMGVDGAGSWFLRGTTSERTAREAKGSMAVDQVETTSYDGRVSLFVADGRDGSMTAVTQAGDDVLSDGWPTLTVLANTQVLDAIVDGDSLYLAAEARDDNGVAQGLIVYKGTPRGWREELKHPFTGLRPTDEHQTSKFVRQADGALQVWSDIDGAALRFDRGDAGWRQSMRIDMAGEGFGGHASERQVEILQASDDAVFIRRATWNFALKQQVLRIEGSMVTAVIDLPSAVRAVVPHSDMTLSLVYADGTLGKVVNSAEIRSDGDIGRPPSTGTLMRSVDDDLYVYRDGQLTILTAR